MLIDPEFWLCGKVSLVTEGISQFFWSFFKVFLLEKLVVRFLISLKINSWGKIISVLQSRNIFHDAVIFFFSLLFPKGWERKRQRRMEEGILVSFLMALEISKEKPLFLFSCAF